MARDAPVQALLDERQWLICLLIRAGALIGDDTAHDRGELRIAYEREGSGPVSITVARGDPDEDQALAEAIADAVKTNEQILIGRRVREVEEWARERARSQP